MWRILFALCVVLLIFPVEPSYAVTQSDGVLRRVRVPTLMYHYISNPPSDADVYRLDLSVTPNHFRQQMQWLKESGYHTISPDDLAAALQRGKRLPDKSVLLTFDDGYVDAYQNAFPILKEFGFKGTFFVVTQWLDEGRGGYLTWDEAKEMLRFGMSIQDHSRQHYNMRKRDHDWLVYDILGSLETLKAHTGIRPLFFCYPAGEFDQNVIKELKAAGFVAAFTTNDGTYAYSDDMLRLPRVRIRGSTTIAGFAELLAWDR